MFNFECRFCGKSIASFSINRSINHYELYQCPSCGSIGVSQEPTPEEIKNIYDNLFSVGEYEQHRRDFDLIKSGKNAYQPYRKLLLRLIEFQLYGRKMLEIGGGTGAFGVYAKSRGWDYLDMDVSEVAVNFAHELGLNANWFSTSSLPSLPTSEFNVVVMWEVIEHIYRVKGYLDEIYRSLKPGGSFLFSTPNYCRKTYQNQNFGGLGAPPIHINFFTKNSLEILLKVTGFTGIRVFKRRIYSPVTHKFKDIKTSIKRLLAIEEPPTLIGIAKKSK